MTVLHGIAGGIVAGMGLVLVRVALSQRHLSTVDAAGWLADGMVSAPVSAGRGPAGSPVARLVVPLYGRLAGAVIAMTPKAHLDRLHDQVLRAGLGGRLRAEDILAVNILSAAAAATAAALWVVAVAPPVRLGVTGCIAIVLTGTIGPSAWLRRKGSARQEAIFNDLADALDLMVIGMEAGVTFDGALQVVAEHLDTPLGQELARTLAEMELGLSRRDALLNLKRRVGMPEVTNVVVALLQADALGMSVSRVLRVQAHEMRAKRRQWAREKAGKLPVKILFPLVVFIFPPVMVVILGPAMGDIRGLFG